MYLSAALLLQTHWLCTYGQNTLRFSIRGNLKRLETSYTGSADNKIHFPVQGALGQLNELTNWPEQSGQRKIYYCLC